MVFVLIFKPLLMFKARACYPRPHPIWIWLSSVLERTLRHQTARSLHWHWLCLISIHYSGRSYDNEIWRLHETSKSVSTWLWVLTSTVPGCLILKILILSPAGFWTLGITYWAFQVKLGRLLCLILWYSLNAEVTSNDVIITSLSCISSILDPPYWNSSSFFFSKTW